MTETEELAVATMMEMMQERHSVRSYTDEPIEENLRAKLRAGIEQENTKGDLSMRLVCDEPRAFDSALAHYGKFVNVCNYVILAGKPAADLDERCGYYGERIVLAAQELGLNTCWVALTFKKRFVRKALDNGDKLVLVIAIGHGVDGGKPHKSKDMAELCRIPADSAMPSWFLAGMDAALLAPTAVNQQKFEIELTDDRDAQSKPLVALHSKDGAYSNVDLGIVRLHFELGAGTDNFSWANPL